MPISVITSEPMRPATDSQSPDSHVAVTISSARCMKVAGSDDRIAETTMQQITSGSALG